MASVGNAGEAVNIYSFLWILSQRPSVASTEIPAMGGGKQSILRFSNDDVFCFYPLGGLKNRWVINDIKRYTVHNFCYIHMESCIVNSNIKFTD